MESNVVSVKGLDTYVINIAITRQRLLDLIVTAVEGGSNYWADFSDAERDADLNYLKVRVVEKDASGQRRINRWITPDEMAIGLIRLGGASFPAAAKHLCDVDRKSVV